MAGMGALDVAAVDGSYCKQHTAQVDPHLRTMESPYPRPIRELCPTHARWSCALHTRARFNTPVPASWNGMLRVPLKVRNALMEEQSWRTPSARTRHAHAPHHRDKPIAAHPVNMLRPADRRARKPCANARIPVAAVRTPERKNETPRGRHPVPLAGRR